MNIDARNELSAMDLSLSRNGLPASAERASAEASEKTSWFEAMARVWGRELNQKTDEVVRLSDQMNNGGGESNSMAGLVKFQAVTQELSFLSNGASTAVKTSGEALKTLASRN